MTNQSKKPKYIVLQYLRIVFLMAVMGYPYVHFAQIDRSDQWQKSVRSLTIFQPGDAVRITVWDLQSLERQYLDFSRDYPINPEGYIIMPIIGEVKVKGLTLYELSQTLEERFKDHPKETY